MKPYNLLAIILAVYVTSTGCRKISDNRPQPEIENTAPSVKDNRIALLYPAGRFLLKTVVSDREDNVVKYQWRKVSGPDQYIFETPDAKETFVSGLEAGDYKFALTATDAKGLMGEGLVSVSIVSAGNNEMIFRDLTWGCPMGCSVSVSNFSSFVPAGIPITVFIQLADGSWQLVKEMKEMTSSDKYGYSVNDNYFWIYTDDASGKVNVKIRF